MADKSNNADKDKANEDNEAKANETDKVIMAKADLAANEAHEADRASVAVEAVRISFVNISMMVT